MDYGDLIEKLSREADFYKENKEKFKTDVNFILGIEYCIEFIFLLNEENKNSSKNGQ